MAMGGVRVRVREGGEARAPLFFRVDATFCFRDNYVEEGARGERAGSARACERACAATRCLRVRAFAPAVDADRRVGVAVAERKSAYAVGT